MRHMQAGLNLGLSTTRSTQIADGWEHAFVSRVPIQHHAVSLKEVNYLFPLYLYPTETPTNIGTIRELNLDPNFVETLGIALGLDFIGEGTGDLSVAFGPEDIFHYVYAVLHSPEYRRRYADFLKSDFPRIPLTGDRSLFAALAELGQRLAALHLMEAEGANLPAFPLTGGNRVERVRYAPPSSEEEPAACGSISISVSRD